MKCSIPEISWHNRVPVLSVNIQPVCNEEFYRLASGGADYHVLIWYLKIRSNGGVDVEVVSDLTRHQRAVNVVRWSPSGQYLASGDDDANIIIWNLKTDNIPLLEGETSDKEVWVVNKVLRCHKEDVYDISWSPSGLKLISGSIDNTAILWDFTKGRNEHILTDHKGFVQGVAWDPKGEYIATISSDRTCRIFESLGSHVKARIHKGLLPFPESHPLFNKDIKYFHDDTFKSFFRRLAFSPDGNLLIVPSGCIEFEEYKAVRHCSLIFTLGNLTQPAAVLPSPKQVTIAICCCPILFELLPDGSEPIISLPYRMVIAVATESDVILYDTQQLVPFAHMQKIHYTRITDLTWSHDGRLLIASSTDGFCTLVTFEPDELGTQFVKADSDLEDSIMDISVNEGLSKIDSSKKNKEQEQAEVKNKKQNILQQWTIRKNKSGTTEEENKICILNGATTDGNLLVMNTKKDSSQIENKTPSKALPKKRIVPIRVEEVKKKRTEKTSNETRELKSPKLDKQQMEESEAKENVVCISDDEEPDDRTDSCENEKQERQIELKVKKQNILEQWTVRKSKTDNLEAENTLNPISEKSMQTNKISEDRAKETPKKVPKKIVPIRIGDVKKKY